VVEGEKCRPRKFTKRMKDILALLAGRIPSITFEELKEHLKKASLDMAPLLIKLGKIPKLEVTDEDVKKEYFNHISLSVKSIILSLEPHLNRNYSKMFRDDFDCVDIRLAVEGYYPDSRYTVSLPEIISGKLFPKGRVGWYRTRCEGYSEYREAKKKADVLFASYTRTLKKLLKYGLVAVNPFNAKTYYITRNGLSVLKNFGLLNTSEAEKRFRSHFQFCQMLHTHIIKGGETVS